jgi:hypothetical protein
LARFSDIAMIVGEAFVRASTGGKDLSPEMTQLMALVMFDGYELFPAAHAMPLPEHSLPEAERDVIEHAKRIGTYGKIDRSAQYQGRYSTEMLLRSDNHQWARLRRLENLQLRNAVIVAAISAFLARAPEILGFLDRLLR